ncbi:hypothetical protein CSUNSWCD_117 [Campylobacter showae CSUNSWCD]|uniref:Uncharacterized protein n=1 Tax=Campylobacter showae CSUNSWCD TaxID=1244083 RepID=M5II04_9BACT|nr:hypothetical protein CSUNSWCD_117 [Campylobacter showae CSUNSWCD]
MRRRDYFNGKDKPLNEHPLKTASARARLSTTMQIAAL